MKIGKILKKTKKYIKNIFVYINSHNTTINIALGSIAVIGISMGFSQIMPESATAKTNISRYEGLKTFEEIDAIAHQRREILYESDAYNREWDRLFQISDNSYHAAEDIHQKFDKAQELNELIKEQNGFFEEEGYIDPADNTAFYQLEQIFDSLVQN